LTPSLAMMTATISSTIGSNVPAIGHSRRFPNSALSFGLIRRELVCQFLEPVFISLTGHLGFNLTRHE
jgi:hypothetical protein